jgi:L-alanine-DL-glutamate epimerase-like enolase superfamily enzyme
VYALAAERIGLPVPHPFRAPCYDTSLYFDDLELASDDEAAALLAGEAREGYALGHRAFKLKIGRGARHMPLEAGTRRDIAVVRAVHAALGPGVPLLLDANNGYNLNLAKRVLAETAGCGVLWLEEAFHEDPVLYGDLREWLAANHLPVLIADGEGLASPYLLDWARAGLIDVIQYDVNSFGFSAWLSTGPQLDAWGVRSAPHHYGTHYGNYAGCHLAGAMRNFVYAEWDEVTTPGLEAPGYVIEDGCVHVPNAPGFGLHLDDRVFRAAVEAEGFRLTV